MGWCDKLITLPKFLADNAKCKAAVQEFTATTLLKLVYSSSLDSKLFTTLPVVSHPFLIEPAKNFRNISW